MTIEANLRERYVIQTACEKDPEKQLAAFVLCRKDQIAFFKYWLWTFDPRKAIKDLPFIPWDYQEEYLLNLDKDIRQGTSQLTEKSRDMGVTWMVLGTFLYRWLFFDENFLVGSKKEEDCDRIGDIKTHFERMRYMLSKLPDWMIALCGWDRRNSSYLKLFKGNGASIVGEAMTPEFSRQGRYKAILLDEFAFVDSAETVWRACGDSAPCKIPISTPNGTNNKFAELRKSGKIKVVTLDWRKHPEKDAAWYAKQVQDRSAKDVAQEIDINYTVSAGSPFYTGFARALHLRNMTISRERPIVPCWDYGFTHPNCSLHQMSVEGIWIIVDNIFGENQTIEEFGEHVKEFLNANYAGYLISSHGYGDPAGNQSSDKSRKSSVQILKELGFLVQSVPSNLPTTNYAARKTIIERKLRTLINGIPALVVNDVPNNNIIVEGFEGGYRYPDANKYGGVAEHPVEDGWFEHPFNSLEYFAVNRFKVVETDKREEKQRDAKMRSHRASMAGKVNAGFQFA